MILREDGVLKAAAFENFDQSCCPSQHLAIAHLHTLETATTKNQLKEPRSGEVVHDGTCHMAHGTYTNPAICKSCDKSGLSLKGASSSNIEHTRAGLLPIKEATRMQTTGRGI